MSMTLLHINSTLVSLPFMWHGSFKVNSRSTMSGQMAKATQFLQLGPKFAKAAHVLQPDTLDPWQIVAFITTFLLLWSHKTFIFETLKDCCKTITRRLFFSMWSSVRFIVKIIMFPCVVKEKLLVIRRRLTARSWRNAPIAVKPDKVERYFTSGGRQYFKPDAFSPLYECVPSRCEAGVDGTTPKIVWDLKQIPVSQNESILSAQVPQKVIGDLPPWIVFLGVKSPGVEDIQGIGCGWIEDGWLFTARHTTDHKDAIAAKCAEVYLYRKPGQEIAVKIHDMKRVDFGDNLITQTGFDIVAFKLNQKAICRLAVKSAKELTYFNTAMGHVSVYGNPTREPLISTGLMEEDSQLQRERGLIAHRVNTVGGFSGSPLIYEYNGTSRIVGMHICTDGKRNYGVSLSCIRKLREKCGVSTLARMFISESRNERSLQDEFKYMERENAMTAYLEDHINVMVHGDFGDREDLRLGEDYDRAMGWLTEPRNRRVQGWNPERDADETIKRTDSKFVGSHDPAELVCQNLSLGHASFKQLLVATGLERDALIDVLQELVRKNKLQALVIGKEHFYKLKTFNHTRYDDGSEPPLIKPTTWKGLAWKNTVFDEEVSDMQGMTDPYLCDLDEVDVDDIIRSAMVTGNWMVLHNLLDVGHDMVWDSPILAQYRRYVASSGIEEQHCDYARAVMPDKDGLPFARRVGKYAHPHCKKPKGVVPLEPALIAKLQEAGLSINVGDWVDPPSGRDAVLDSLRAQASLQKRGDWSLLDDKKFAEYCDKFPKVPTPGIGSWHDFDKIFSCFDSTKSTGWSGLFKPGPKASWMNKEGYNFLIYLVICRWALRMANYKELNNMLPFEMVQRGLIDPRMLFVKSEPHDAKKQKSKKWRLIWNVSIVDAVCQSLVHHDQNKADIRHYQGTTESLTAVGLGHHDSGLAHTMRCFGRLFENGAGTVSDSDASGWDLSVRRDAIMADAVRRIRCAIPDPSDLAASMYAHAGTGEGFDTYQGSFNLHANIDEFLWAEALVNSAHVVAIEGQLWEICVFGITASGIPSTGAQNSAMRALLMLLCGATDVLACGDDEVHSGQVDYDLLSSTGCITKDDEHVVNIAGSTPVDFTSHSYGWVGDKQVFSFNNVSKLLARACFQVQERGRLLPEQIAGMSFCLRNNAVALAGFKSWCESEGWEFSVGEDSAGYDE